MAWLLVWIYTVCSNAGSVRPRMAPCACGARCASWRYDGFFRGEGLVQSKGAIGLCDHLWRSTRAEQTPGPRRGINEPFLLHMTRHINTATVPF